MARKVVVNLNISSDVPLPEQLAQELRMSITSGRLAAGARLPSIKEISRQLQVSATTVRSALNRLVEERLVEQRPGSGNFVSRSAVDQARASGSEAAAAMERDDWVSAMQASARRVDAQAVSEAQSVSDGSVAAKEAASDRGDTWTPAEALSKKGDAWLPAEALLLLEQAETGPSPGSTGGLEQPPIAGDSDEACFTQSTYESAFLELDARVPWSTEARLLTAAFNDSPFHPFGDARVDYDFRVYQPAMEPAGGLNWKKVVVRWAQRRSARRLSAGNSDPRTLPELRQEISTWLNHTQSLDCSPEDLFITSGAQQARDCVARLLIDPGKGVVVEEPGNITTTLVYSSKGADLIPVHQDDDGVDVRQLEHVKTASVAHLTTTASFPTGAALSSQRRESVLDWAQTHNVTVVEDSYGAGFYYAPVLPALYSLAQKRGNAPYVVHTGSLSQLINPALRLGFIIVPAVLQDSFIAGRWLAEQHTSAISHELALMLFKEGAFTEDSLHLTQTATARRKALLSALEQWPPGLIRYTPVQAGFQQAIWFVEPVDDLLVCERALKQRIGVIPISPCYISEEARSGLSLSFMQMSEERITQGMELLLKIVLESRSTG